ncbi:Spy/CpxP family protein refolding chaperone [Oceanobacter mangrovi]|uniref:Spy/CpxP family protein refolding chaperone n=1 Tax=Oceanobacter mangrovi TaxID=2862510 RepID=UPI001C8EBA31|nr:periplasmic heavy metal sensor [Oceanobacter mangrovi]
MKHSSLFNYQHLLAIGLLAAVVGVTGCSPYHHGAGYQQPPQQQPYTHMMQGSGYGPGTMYGGQQADPAAQPYSAMPMMGGYGYGPGGYGRHGVMAGSGCAQQAAIPDLTDEQQQQMQTIQNNLADQHWALMQNMHQAQLELRSLYQADQPDEVAIKAAYDKMNSLRLAMYGSQQQAREQMDKVLTDEQRKAMQQYGYGMPMRPMW